MSKGVFSWAMSQQHLPRGQFLVLRELCFLHSEDKGCFPSQKTLTRRTKYSRSTLNTHLKALESAGLIHRQKRKGANGQRQSTLYTFPAYATSPATQLIKETKTMSKNDVHPCPGFGKTHVQNSDTNKDKFKTNSTSERPTQQVSALFAASEGEVLLGQRVIDALGKTGKHCTGKYWQPLSATAHFNDLRREIGLSEDQIVTEITKIAKNFIAAPNGPKAYDEHLRNIALQVCHKPPTSGSVNGCSAIAGFWVLRMQNGRPISASAIAPAVRSEIITNSLLEPEVKERYPDIFR